MGVMKDKYFVMIDQGTKRRFYFPLRPYVGTGVMRIEMEEGGKFSSEVSEAVSEECERVVKEGVEVGECCVLELNPNEPDLIDSMVALMGESGLGFQRSMNGIPLMFESMKGG